MARQMEISFEGFERSVRAVLLDEEEPAACNELWEELAEPLVMWPWHTTSTGDYYGCRGRAPRHPSNVGSQAVPMGARRKMLCELDPGWITYAGGREMSFAYGPDITEPLPAKGPVFAKVRTEDLPVFYEAGLHIWNAQFRTHKLVRVTARRVED